MDNLSKKTVILLQIVVIVFIAILIKNLCVNSSTTSQQEGFACEDSCASNRSSSNDGCFITAPKGCPKKQTSFLNNENKDECIEDINITDVNKLNPLECERRKHTYIKNCSISPEKPEDIKTFFYNTSTDTFKSTFGGWGKFKRARRSIRRPSRWFSNFSRVKKPSAQEVKLEGIASQNNKIIFFSKPNYQGEVFSIDIPSRRTKGYFNKKTQRFVVYDALSKPPEFLRGPICIGSVIIPDNRDVTLSKFRNIKLVLKDDDESNIDGANNITISKPNIGEIQATYYEISPRLDTLDTYTAKQVLEHNKRKIDGLNRILTTNIDELKENSIEKNETQQETINNMCKRISKNVDKIINNIGYRLINGRL